jgi:hypothetical protein
MLFVYAQQGLPGCNAYPQVGVCCFVWRPLLGCLYLIVHVHLGAFPCGTLCMRCRHVAYVMPMMGHVPSSNQVLRSQVLRLARFGSARSSETLYHRCLCHL